MKEDFLFGVMLVGSVVFMLVVVTCTIIVIAMQSRELEREAATLSTAEVRRENLDPAKSIESYLTVRVWSDGDQLEAQQQQQQEGGAQPQSPDDKDETDYEQNNDECSICLRSFRQNDVVAHSSCNDSCRHEFHRDCIADWLKIQAKCPCCRQSFLGNNRRGN